MHNITYLSFILILLSQPVYSQIFEIIEDSSSPINTVELRGFYRGCAWADVDNDGDLDLATQGWAFRNLGEDQFEIIESFGRGPDGVHEFLGGISWADHDNDGDVDALYSATINAGGSFGRTIIYDNDGTGEFTEKQVDSTASLATWSASWGNFNNDAFIDVIGAVAFGFASLNTPAFFYKGNPDGSFSKVTSYDFTQDTGPYTVAYWTDFDSDGDSDLLIATGPGGAPGPDHHYLNTTIENGFEGLDKITDAAFATDPQDGQCYNLVDFDLDGDLDLFLTNYSGAANKLYENQDGDWVSIQNALTFGGSALGNCWGDFDNDGDQDVIITADNLNLAGYFENQGGTFEKTENPFLNTFGAGNVSGLSIGDYNGDGALDFFANGGVQSQNGSRGLFKNVLENDNNWIQLDLVGATNRSALGAQLWVKVDIDGQSTWLHREVSAQNTFMGHNALRVHFGLAQTETIDSLKVLWPGAQEEYFTNLAVNNLHIITEGDGITGISKLNEFIDFKVLPNPGQNLVLIEFPEPFAGELIILDSLGKEVQRYSVEGPQTNLDVSNLSSGMYQLLWRTKNFMHKKPFVVE